LQDPPKFTQILNFGFENKPSGNTGRYPPNCFFQRDPEKKFFNGNPPRLEGWFKKELFAV
jgi:hypothetical protein